MRKPPGLLLMIAAMLMFAALLPGTSIAQESVQSATVTASALNVRSGPGMNYGVIGLAYRGEVYPVVQATRGWTQVEYKGQAAWMATSFLRLSSEAPASEITGPVASTSERPSTSSPLAGGKLVFATSPGGAIYTLNADGSSLRVVGAGIDPAWSPDGTKIAYADWVTPRGIYVMNADGSERGRIGEQALSKAPAWSPDGSEIVFNFQSGGTLEDSEQCYFGFCFFIPKDPFWRLGIIQVAERSFREPTSDLHSFSPSFRSNGDILFDGDGGLRVIDPDTNNPPVTVAGDSRLFDPRECEAGGRIASTYFQHDHWEIYRLNSDGAGLRRLTGSESVLTGTVYDNVAPEWNPDCTEIIFLSNRDGRWRPYIMSADGSNQRPFLPAVMDTLVFDYGYSSDRVFDWHP